MKFGNEISSRPEPSTLHAETNLPTKRRIPLNAQTPKTISKENKKKNRKKKKKESKLSCGEQFESQGFLKKIYAKLKKIKASEIIFKNSS